ncbi:hypothetical protein D9757_014382 [Collybiopsis confluens]|uniref:Uncharacterized protein n=1 Tax=Collybiopsis confluens TaxID=2823264 RepID=A0A8H5D0G7_9AGAR|nr:hypothetical protein D9757_014382 [Collybiopsis confluens]
MQIRTMWFKKPTGTSVLFILNRYSFLLFLPIALVEITPGNSTDQGVYAIYNKSRIILALATPCIAFAFDAFISGLTILRTIRHAISMRRLGQASVTETALFAGNNISTIWTVIIPFFNISLPNILISRLVLNLRTFSSFEETRSQTITTISGMNFATNRMLGNIGAPMQSGVEQEEEDVEE